MAENNLITKTSLRLLKHENITNYKAMADNLHVDVYIARIGKEINIYFYVRCNTLVNTQVFRMFNQQGLNL